MKTLIYKNGKKLKLNQSYGLKELLELNLDSAFYHGIAGEFFVPTECVLKSPKDICAIQTGRIYRTNLFRRGDEALTYEDLASQKDFKGTYHEDELLLLEIWSDVGQDGHVAYRFFGDWSLICYSDLKCFLKTKGHGEIREFTIDEDITEWLRGHLRE